MRRQQLVDARKAAGRTQEQVAELVGVDRTTVGKWERDESTPRPNQRPAYAEALRVTLSELALMLSRTPADGDEMPGWLRNYLDAEQSAKELRAYEPEVVYGLLQTPAYTSGVVSRVGLTPVPAAYIDSRVRQRQYRQARVRDGGLTLDLIQAEQALRVRVGDARVMAEQLRAMVDLAGLPNVTIRVVTFEAGQHEARRLDTFVIMSHAWGSPRVWVEGYGGERFITDAGEVGYFSAVYDQAVRLALSPTDSIAFIGQLATEWEARA